MSGYTKLFSSIVTSTVWRLDHPTRLVWITMLAIADRHGAVEASVPGLADLARVTREECDAALATLASPDADSRTKDLDGVRIVPADGGWQLVNHSKYRDKMSAEERRERNAEYMRGYRARGVITTGHGISPASLVSEVEHAEAEAAPEDPDSPAAPRTTAYPKAFETVWEQTGRRGSKLKALRAWAKGGKPTWDIVGSPWEAYLASDRPAAGFVKDLSTWLNERGWEQEWAKAAPRGQTPAVTKPPEAPRCEPHRLRDRSPRQMGTGTAETCCDCKGVLAARGTRVTTEEGAMEQPNWMKVGGGR